MLNFLRWALIVDLLSSFLVESRQLNWLHKFILLLTIAKKLQPLPRLMIASSKQPKLFGLCCYEMKHFILTSQLQPDFDFEFYSPTHPFFVSASAPPCVLSTNPRLVDQFRSNKVQRDLQHMKHPTRFTSVCCRGLLCICVTNQSL